MKKRIDRLRAPSMEILRHKRNLSSTLNKTLPSGLLPKRSLKIPSSKKINPIISRFRSLTQIQILEEGLCLSMYANRYSVLQLRYFLIKRLRKKTIADLRKFFYDLNNTKVGYLRPEDLQKSMRKLNFEAEIEDVRSLMLAVTNGKEKLNFPDFLKLIDTRESREALDTYFYKNVVEFTSQSLSEALLINKIQNLLKYYLNFRRLALLREFSAFNNVITYNQYLQAVNNLGIPYHSINAINLKILFCDYGGTNTINYIYFMDKIEHCSPFILDEKREKQFIHGHKKVDPRKNPYEELIDLFQTMMKNKDFLLKELLENYGLFIKKNEFLDYFRPKSAQFLELFDEFFSNLEFDNHNRLPVSFVGNLVFSKHHLYEFYKTSVTPMLLNKSIATSLG